MNNFEYVRATAIPDALRAVADQAGSRFLAGGTTMVDLMKCGVEVPAALIDITRLRASIPSRLVRRACGLALSQE